VKNLPRAECPLNLTTPPAAAGEAEAAT